MLGFRGHSHLTTTTWTFCIVRNRLHGHQWFCSHLTAKTKFFWHKSCRQVRTVPYISVRDYTLLPSMSSSVADNLVSWSSAVFSKFSTLTSSSLIEMFPPSPPFSSRMVTLKSSCRVASSRSKIFTNQSLVCNLPILFECSPNYSRWIHWIQFLLLSLDRYLFSVVSGDSHIPRGSKNMYFVLLSLRM